MDFLALLCTGALLAGGLYRFVCILGPAEQKGKRAVDLSGGSISAEKVQDKYKQIDPSSAAQGDRNRREGPRLRRYFLQFSH
ncbi:hypothetical protein K1719_035383 [Acacia pycnantha]|nr:hypothetical protein K1719_035383 [Acacia pycnantha]